VTGRERNRIYEASRILDAVYGSIDVTEARANWDKRDRLPESRATSRARDELAFTIWHARHALMSSCSSSATSRRICSRRCPCRTHRGQTGRKALSASANLVWLEARILIGRKSRQLI
jgi:hypothetical protein